MISGLLVLDVEEAILGIGQALACSRRNMVLEMAPLH